MARIVKCNLCGTEVESSELGKIWTHVFYCRGRFIHDRYEEKPKSELVCCKCHAYFQPWQKVALSLHKLYCDGELIEQPKI